MINTLRGDGKCRLCRKMGNISRMMKAIRQNQGKMKEIINSITQVIVLINSRIDWTWKNQSISLKICQQKFHKLRFRREKKKLIKTEHSRTMRNFEKGSIHTSKIPEKK